MVRDRTGFLRCFTLYIGCTFTLFLLADYVKCTQYMYTYRVSQKVVYKLNMLVCHIMMNKIYTGTCVRKFKLRLLESDNCTKTEEWDK